jgi:hypothetical protein
MAKVKMNCIGFYNGKPLPGSIMMTFTNPNYKLEWGEIGVAKKANGTFWREGENTVLDEHKAMGYARWVSMAKKGRMVKVTKKMAKIIENTEAATPEKFDKLMPVKKARVSEKIFSGKIELSILARYDDTFKYLIAGNTRLVAQMKWFGEGYVWEYDVTETFFKPFGSMFPKRRRR